MANVVSLEDYIDDVNFRASELSMEPDLQMLIFDRRILVISTNDILTTASYFSCGQKDIPNEIRAFLESDEAEEQDSCPITISRPRDPSNNSIMHLGNYSIVDAMSTGERLPFYTIGMFQIHSLEGANLICEAPNMYSEEENGTLPRPLKVVAAGDFTQIAPAEEGVVERIKVNRSKILQALDWLKANDENYADVDLGEGCLDWVTQPDSAGRVFFEWEEE